MHYTYTSIQNEWLFVPKAMLSICWFQKVLAFGTHGTDKIEGERGSETKKVQQTPQHFSAEASSANVRLSLDPDVH